MNQFSSDYSVAASAQSGHSYSLGTISPIVLFILLIAIIITVIMITGSKNKTKSIAQNTGMYPNSPVGQLKTGRGLLKYILFSLITFGIYPLVFMSSISTDVNIVCSRYDGRRTMHYCLLFFLVGPITLGIAYFVWSHNICNRIGNELRRRGITFGFGASDYWLWNVLGSFIIVGPYIYTHKLSKAMNAMNSSYNMFG